MPTTTTGVATTFIDFTRASNATVTDSDGKVKWAPHNLLPASQNLAGFVFENGVQSPNFSVSPDGSTTALKFTEASTGPHNYYGQPFSVLASVNYTIAIFAKDVDRRYITIGHSDGTNGFYAAFDLVGNTKSACTAIGTGTPVSSQIQPVSNGWYLCSITGSHSVAGSKYITYSLATSLSPTVDTVGRESYASASKAALLWGAAAYRSDLAMQPNTSAYPMYNPTTPKNLAGFTEDFSGTGWTRVNLLANGSGSVANAVVNPVNGLQTADLIVESTANGYHSVYRSFTSVANTPYLWSAYVKPAGRTIVQIAAQATTNVHIVEFNLTGSGTATTRSGSGTAAITALSDGWYRISTIATATGSGTAYWQIDLCNAANTNSYTGDGTSGIYLWGAQLSDSASLDSYSPVYGAAVTSAAYYGPRRDFDGSTLACKGLLVEEQRVNLMTYSNDMTQTVWTAYSSALATTANSALGPDGQTSANTITLSANVRVNFFAVTASTTYTISVWLRTDTGTKNICIGDLNDASSATTTVSVDTTWRRYTHTYTKGAANSSAYIGILQNAGVSPSTSGTVYAWGWQYDSVSGGNAPFATSYIPTGSASATRNGDVASVSTQAFPYSSTEGTVVVNASVVGGLTGSNNALVSLDDGSVNNSNFLYFSNAIPNSGTNVGGVTQQSIGISSVTVTANTAFKSAMAYKANDFAATANGATVVTDTSGAVPSGLTIMNIGNYASNLRMNGHIRQITYLPRRISNADLVTRST